MERTITLPATVEEAVESLEGISQLMTAKGWERAALIFCLTTNEGKGRPVVNVQNWPFTQAEFASLGITGLKSRETVGRYRKRWVKYGDTDVKLGDTIVLPSDEWPPIESRPNKHRVERMEPTDLAEHIAARPDSGEVIAKVIHSDDRAAAAAVEAATEKLDKKRVTARREGRNVDPNPDTGLNGAVIIARLSAVTREMAEVSDVTKPMTVTETELLDNLLQEIAGYAAIIDKKARGELDWDSALQELET